MKNTIFNSIILGLLVAILAIQCMGAPEAKPSAKEDIAEKTVANATIVEAKEALPTENPTTEGKDVSANTETRQTTQVEIATLKKPSAKKTPPPPPKPVIKEKPATEVIETVEVETEVVPVAKKKQPKPEIKRPNHSAWDAFLRKNVSSSGAVNYAAIKANPSNLDAYIEALAAHHPASDWSRNEKMAYWINAYNAFTIKKIIDNYPLKSITDLDGGKPWDVQWIELGSKTYSLNNIENDILRPKFDDARIHFAVNCAAKSCPPLLNRAFTSQKLNSQLESQTRKFINNPSYTTITESSAEVSKIFEWYAVDFGDLRTFLNTYSTTKLNADATISYKEYDWALNNK